MPDPARLDFRWCLPSVGSKYANLEKSHLRNSLAHGRPLGAGRPVRFPFSPVRPGGLLLGRPIDRFLPNWGFPPPPLPTVLEVGRPLDTRLGAPFPRLGIRSPSPGSAAGRLADLDRRGRALLGRSPAGCCPDLPREPPRGARPWGLSWAGRMLPVRMLPVRLVPVRLPPVSLEPLLLGVPMGDWSAASKSRPSVSKAGSFRRPGKRPGRLDSLLRGRRGVDSVPS